MLIGELVAVYPLCRAGMMNCVAESDIVTVEKISHQPIGVRHCDGHVNSQPALAIKTLAISVLGQAFLTGGVPYLFY